MKKKLGFITCVLFFSTVFFTATSTYCTLDYTGANVFSGSYIPNNPPYVPSNPDPANGSTNVDIDINLSWTGGDPDPGDIVTYNIFFGRDPNPPIVETVYPDETYDPGRLTYNTQYYWKIDAYDNQQGVAEGPIWTFTTRDDNPPYTPNNPHPVNGATDVNISISLHWFGGDPDPGDIVTYDVYFGTDPNPPNVALNYTDTTYDIYRLEYNTQYYWRIDAWDDYGYSTTGPTWTFTTRDDNQPYTPSNPFPADGSIDVDTNISLNWTGGDPDPGDIVTYDVYFGTDPNPPNVATGILNTTYNFTDRLEYNTQYYWRIDAWDDYGYSTTGPTWTFTTRDDNPPYTPSNPSPENNSANVNTLVILSWTGGDPDGDPVVYDVYFGTDPNPPNVAMGYPNTTYDPGVLQNDTWYYWRIDAWDDYGYSTTGPTWRFRTTIYSSNPPDKPSTPQGPTSGKTGVSYTYRTTTTDPDGDQIYYLFDWDDGTNSGWLGPYDSGVPAEASHVWDARGSYSIKVKARDVYGAESVWSDPLPISMPKTLDPQESNSENFFEAELGLSDNQEPLVFLNGVYRVYRDFLIMGGSCHLFDSEKTGRFQGISTKNQFILQTVVNNQIINIVGTYTSFDRNTHMFRGIWKGFIGGNRVTHGWITGSYT